MNIDFHYGVIYIVARLGGLSAKDAQVVAHACQYVDDATTNGILKFEGGETFERFASAHELFDYHNTLNDHNRLVWVPFHFLPGAQGKTLEDKAVCKPNSLVAREMVKRALACRDADNALHRLGVTLHVYVDTWAHQGFSGIISKHNTVTSLTGDDHDHDTWFGKLRSFLSDAGHNVEALVLDTISSLGHGAALHFPDLPWARWNYKNGHGIEIQRNNLEQFMEAANMACKAIQGFVRGTLNYEAQAGLGDRALKTLRDLLASNQSHDEKERLQVIAKAVEQSAFPAISEQLPKYISKGVGSWKHQATGIIDVDDGDRPPQWSENFESSHYRKFHDAVKEHRFVVINAILPAHGLRLA